MDGIITQQFPEQPVIGEPISVDTAEVAVEETVPEDSGDTPLVAPLDFMAVVRRDARAAHFLVDVISGCDVDESVSRNFSGADAIAQAEERGYRRGLNERAESQMSRPGAYEEIRPPKPECSRNGTTLLTTTSRTSVWDID